MWLRMYNTYYSLSLVFKVSITDVSRCVNNVWPILLRVIGINIVWPTHLEWLGMRHNWNSLIGVVGCIDGTSHEIQIPHSNQRNFYSGHRRYHCVHTQIIIDNSLRIRFLKSGFVGHHNGAFCYAQLQKLALIKSCTYPRTVGF